MKHNNDKHNKHFDSYLDGTPIIIIELTDTNISTW